MSYLIGLVAQNNLFAILDKGKPILIWRLGPIHNFSRFNKVDLTSKKKKKKLKKKREKERKREKRVWWFSKPIVMP